MMSVSFFPAASSDANQRNTKIFLAPEKSSRTKWATKIGAPQKKRTFSMRRGFFGEKKGGTKQWEKKGCSLLPANNSFYHSRNKKAFFTEKCRRIKTARRRNDCQEGALTELAPGPIACSRKATLERETSTGSIAWWIPINFFYLFFFFFFFLTGLQSPSSFQTFGAPLLLLNDR